MNKSQLILKLSSTANITKKKAETLIDLIFNSMIDALKSNDRIEIRGFGSFVNRSYKSYTGRNPKSGEPVQVGEKRLPFFKVGKELKEKIDK